MYRYMDKLNSLIDYEKELYRKIDVIRHEIQILNREISIPNSSFEVIKERNKKNEEFAQLNQNLVVVESQLNKYKKEKSTVRQESTFEN